MPERTIGVVGLGAMGLPIASALHRAQSSVVGFDVVESARDRATGQSVPVTDDLGALARDCDVLVLSLPTPAVVRDVVERIAVAARPGTVVLDTSTIDPGTSQDAARRLEEVGSSYADCPVLGRPSAVGRWTMPLGGSDEVVALAREVLAPVAARIVHVGAVGMGVTLKILNNMMLATINAATAEALVLAEAAGLDPGTFVDTLVDSGAASISGLFREVAPRAVDGDFTPTFSLRLMHKDNDLALRMADRHGVPLPVATATQTLTTMGVAAGHGDEDSVAVIKVLETITRHAARRH